MLFSGEFFSAWIADYGQQVRAEIAYYVQQMSVVANVACILYIIMWICMVAQLRPSQRCDDKLMTLMLMTMMLMIMLIGA